MKKSYGSLGRDRNDSGVGISAGFGVTA